MKRIIVKGKAKGVILKSKDPINFLGAVDKKTGIIRDKKYDIFEKSMKDTVLVFPHGIGSSVGAYTIYSLKSNQSAPIAMICKKADLTVASGCALANIPMIVVSTEEFDSIENIEVTSNPFNGTQIFFVSPASSDDSGTLTLSGIEETFTESGLWTANTYNVEIIADINLV